jgi:hypothetical protein
MQIILIVLGYLKWHYGKAIRSLTRVWQNFLFFISEFFSIKLLFRNFFDPWKRMTDPYPKSFSFKEYFYAFLTNLIVRIVGMLMRTTLIIVGLIAYLVLIGLYPVTLISWLALPLIVLALISFGLFLIIT